VVHAGADVDPRMARARRSVNFEIQSFWHLAGQIPKYRRIRLLFFILKKKEDLSCNQPRTHTYACNDE
jgi:hypothetical protein